MPLFNILVVLIFAGIVLWLINNYIPMDYKIKRIINIVFVIVIIFWLLNVFGLLNGLMNIKV
jgi:hypothetical protein